MNNSLSAVLHAFGSPADLKVEPQPPAPLPNTAVRLRMLFAPVNPADLNVLEGKYGLLPELPTVAGSEGVGEIIEVGAGCSRVKKGDMVLPLQRGTWAREMVVDEYAVVPLPAGVDPQQAAMLSVNPPTAYGLLTSFLQLLPGDWVVQNAANSGLGQSLIQVAKQLGLRTVNVVRRAELEPELKALGADVVVTEEVDLRKEMKALTGGKQARLACNAVGGASALNLANALQDRGVHVTYGAMGRQPLKIPNGLLIFRELQFRGFWLSSWLPELSGEERDHLFTRLAEWAQSGALVQSIDTIFPLSQVTDAVAAAAQERRKGKILLDLQDQSGRN